MLHIQGESKKSGISKISNCSNSLNFEAKINCNTIKPNVPKWRKTCTGLKFDLLNFYGPQSNIHIFENPLFFDSPCSIRASGITFTMSGVVMETDCWQQWRHQPDSSETWALWADLEPGNCFPATPPPPHPAWPQTILHFVNIVLSYI